MRLHENSRWGSVPTQESKRKEQNQAQVLHTLRVLVHPYKPAMRKRKKNLFPAYINERLHARLKEVESNKTGKILGKRAKLSTYIVS